MPFNNDGERPTQLLSSHSPLMIRGTHDPREIKQFASVYNGTVHGDFQVTRNDGTRQCWDIEFSNVILAAKWVDMFDRYFYFIDFREDSRPVSIMSHVVLTAETYNEDE